MLRITIAAAIAASLAIAPATAQIQPDATLGAERSRVRPSQAEGLAIEGGALRGTTLFHSFREFNVREGQQVLFTNPGGVLDILGRVTGGNASQILGQLGVEGSANLFLLNPNGIVFGPNAQLDVSGAFTATTADAFTFGDGLEFSATNPNAAPLLRINITPGLQLGTSGEITLDGTTLKTDRDLTLAAGRLDINGELDAGRDLILRSHSRQLEGSTFTVGGYVLTQDLAGNLVEFTSPHDNVIRANGDVQILGDYTGPSLYVLAGGEVSVGGGSGSIAIEASDRPAEITAAIADGLGGTEEVTVRASDTPTLDIRAGIDWSQVPGGEPGNDNRSTAEVSFGSSAATRSTIAAGEILNPGGTVALSDRFLPNASLPSHIRIASIDTSLGTASAPDPSQPDTIAAIVNEEELLALVVELTLGLSTVAQNAPGVVLSPEVRQTFQQAIATAAPQFPEIVPPPANAEVQRRDRGGDIFIAGRGSVTVGTLDSSSLVFGAGDTTGRNGGNISISTLTGDVRASALLSLSSSFSLTESGTIVGGDGGNISIVSNSGAIAAATSNSGSAALAPESAGNAIAGRGGEIAIATGSGDIELAALGAGTLSIVASGQAIGGDGAQISATTAVGNISGAVFNSTSLAIASQGDTAFSGNGGHLSLTTDSGDIDLAGLPPERLGAIALPGLDLPIGEILASGQVAVLSLAFSQRDGGSGDGGRIQISTQDGDIRFGDTVDSSSLAVSGRAGNGGEIFASAPRGEVTGGALVLLNSSAVSLDNTGSGSGGDLELHVDRLARDLDIFTLASEGEAGSVTISGGNSLLLDKLDITTSSLVTIDIPLFGSQTFLLGEAGGIGQSGDVTISSAGSLTLNASSIASTAQGLEPAGNVRIVSPGAIALLDGTEITSSTNSTGAAGSIAIASETGITLAGDETQLSAATTAGGRAGDVVLEAPTIAIAEGARLSTGTEASGRGGTIALRAADLTLADGATVDSDALNSGRAGNIVIFADRFQLRDGAAVQTNAAATGNAGDIRIDVADRFAIADSQITAATGDTATGRGGNIAIDAVSLDLDNGAIAVLSQGTGRGGNIELSISESLTLERDAGVAAAAASSDGGELTARVGDRLVLSGGSQLNAAAGIAQAEGNGGNIALSADFVIAEPGAENQIVANAFAGNGGNIQIETESLFGLPFLSISASSEFGLDGEIAIDSPETDPTQGLSNLPDNPLDANNQLVAGCRSDDRGRFVLTGRGGIPPSPFQALGDESLLLASELQKSSGSDTGFWAALRAAEDLRSRGLYRRARQRLETEIPVLKPAIAPLDSLPREPRREEAIAWRHYGAILGLTGDLAASRTALERSLAIARALNSADDIGAALLSLGNTFRASGELDAAIGAYRQAAEIAIAPSLSVQALLNQFGILVETQPYETARALSASIQVNLANLPPSRTAIYARLNYIDRLLAVEPDNPNLDALLAAAERDAEIEADDRHLAYVLGVRGQLAERRQQWQTAREATTRALVLSQALNAPELEYRWQWQLGRILTALGDRSAATAAYDNAVANLRLLRGDLASFSTETRFSFRDRVEPVYRELISLLLASEQPSQEELRRARALIEALQLAQLDNFFQDNCSQTNPIAIDRIDPRAAVIYPIGLDDRLAVILSIAGQPLRYRAVAVPRREVEQTLGAFLQAMTPHFSDRQPGQQLYDWIIRPFADDLDRAEIQTLVFVPDRGWRAIAFAALSDGDHYLIEQYNLALSPGLELLPPPEAGERQVREPSVFAAGLAEGRQGFPPLPYVRVELEEIATLIPQEQQLLDRAFTTANATAAIARSPASILHLATHGQFGRRASDTFVLTWDGRLTIDALQQLVEERERETGRILEWLILSACSTAAGDDRATFGLAGMAVRSGARSTLGALWPLADDATAAFMSHFYEALAIPGTTRAQAVREAQLALMRDRRFSDPFFWAPFVLVGNWL